MSIPVMKEERASYTSLDPKDLKAEESKSLRQDAPENREALRYLGKC